ncbi:Hypothetical predicted protein, partial [Mytilus galloprovincialis]
RLDLLRGQTFACCSVRTPLRDVLVLLLMCQITAKCQVQLILECRQFVGKESILGFKHFALTDHDEDEQHFAPVLGGSSGTCSSVLGKKGDVCDSSCGCEPGYKCYRPMSGMCCPPMRCYNATWVEQQQHYWANCHPPTCYYPP